MTTTLGYVIRYVADMERAVRFHQDRLGLKLRFQSPFWSEFETGSATLALHAASADHPAGSCQLGYNVADLEHFYSDALTQGVEFMSVPTEMHGQKIARFKDSEGAECSVSGA